MVVKKRKMESKNRKFCRKYFGRINKFGLGFLSSSMENYPCKLLLFSGKRKGVRIYHKTWATFIIYLI